MWTESINEQIETTDQDQLDAQLESMFIDPHVRDSLAPMFCFRIQMNAWHSFLSLSSFDVHESSFTDFVTY